MLRLSHNPMQACRYSMFAAEQCPKALAWMAALALAAGKPIDAHAWFVELMSAVVLVKGRGRSGGDATRALRDTVGMS